MRLRIEYNAAGIIEGQFHRTPVVLSLPQLSRRDARTLGHILDTPVDKYTR